MARKPKAPPEPATYAQALAAKVAEYEARDELSLEDQSRLATIRTQLAMVEDPDNDGVTDYPLDPVTG